MRTTKARWKPAPIDQRRVAAGRTAPKARFTRRQRSGSLPPSLPSGRGGRVSKPVLTFAIAAIIMVILGVMLVIGVGMIARAQQAYEAMQWRAAYYGRPTQPFSTLAPDAGQQGIGTAMPIVPLAAPDDPRWVRGSAIPISGGFELRTMPTLLNNDPFQTITDTVACYFIVETDWGAWAQIKLGNTTAWVDTSTVRMEAGS